MTGEELVVQLDELTRLGHQLTGAATELFRLAGQAQQAAVEPALLAATPLDPVGVVRTVAEIEAAVAGPHGLLASAALLGVDATTLAAAVVEYAAADALKAVPGEAVSAAARLADVTAAAVAPYAEDGLRRVDRWRLIHQDHLPPPLADAVATAHGIVLATVVREVAAVLPEGPGSAAPTQPSPPAAGDVPAATVGDYLRRVDELYAHPGCVGIVTISGPQPGYVVLLPGVEGSPSKPYPQDLYGAALAAERRDTAYSGAVHEALDAAGVPIGAAVMLVGHSQGGIVAMNLAGDGWFNGTRCRVTHVLAAGSPISTKTVAPGTATRVLSLENRSDIVTHLDVDRPTLRPPSGPPKVERGRTVYTFNRQTWDVIGNHDVGGTYAPVAGSAPPSATASERAAAAAANERFRADPGVASYLDSAQPYLDGSPVSSRYFQLRDRAPAGAPAIPAPRSGD